MLKPGEEKVIATRLAEILRAVVVSPDCLQRVPLPGGGAERLAGLIFFGLMR